MDNRKPIWQTLFIALVLIFAPMKGVLASMVQSEHAHMDHVVAEPCHSETVQDHHDCLDSESSASKMDHHTTHNCCDVAGNCCTPISFFSNESFSIKSVWHALLPKHDSQYFPTPAFKPPRVVAA